MPIEQIGNGLTFEVFYTESKVGKTGLTVTVDVWELTSGGVATEVVSAGNATEMGDGLYYYQLASGTVDAEAVYTAVFKTATATVDQQHIPAAWTVGEGWVENVDASIQTVDTVADGIKAVTDNLPDSGALSTIDANVDAILADTGTDGVAISATVQQAIADEILKRGISNVEDAADATSLAALVLAAFESAIVGTTWTIYKTNHSTTFTTRTVTESGAALPIVEVD